MSSSSITCKINVQIASYNVATSELKEIKCKRNGTPVSTVIEKDRASHDLDLAFWLEKSLSPSPDWIAIGFQELLPQTDIRVLSIPTEQSLFIQNQNQNLYSFKSSSTSSDQSSLPSSSTVTSSSSSPSKTSRLGSQSIAGLEGWIEKLQESISRIHGVQVTFISSGDWLKLRVPSTISYGQAGGLDWVSFSLAKTESLFIICIPEV